MLKYYLTPTRFFEKTNVGHQSEIKKTQQLIEELTISASTVPCPDVIVE